jgi:sensor domain CHASE-containing protein
MSYLEDASGQDRLVVSQAVDSLIVPPHNSDLYVEPEELLYSEFLQSAVKEQLHIDGVSLPGYLAGDIKEPRVTAQLLKLEGITLSQAKYRLQSQAHSSNHDKLVCLVTGELKIVVVPAWERLYVYPEKD